ncbi:hypothetical protein BD414DRAFT_555115 [Trametes punicea]|nr:hypothetical protein BD414DRAFT_555115 [Trametes punicea]
MPRSSKRRRLEHSDSGAVTTFDTNNVQRSCLTSLPLELLAEVLSYATSPRDVLALARTSKHFCSVLVNNPETEFIWRRARQNCEPAPVPDPLPGLSEACYAALLFDHGKCEICGSSVNVPCHSFALRARLCDPPRGCVQVWRSQHLYAIDQEDEVKYPDILQWIPRLERPCDLQLEKIYVRKDAWRRAVSEFKKARLLGPDAVSAYTETRQVLADALPARQEFYKNLIKWRDRRAISLVLYASMMQHRAQIHSEEIGCTKWEILQSPTYAAQYHAKLRCCEAEIQDDFPTFKDAVIAEVAAQKQRKLLREKEHIMQDRRREVETEYKRLKESSQQDNVLPSLPEFRKLSVVKTVEASTSRADPGLTDHFVALILKDNLEQWRSAARAALAAVLGFPGWKMMSKRKLHPVDRLTARFRCKRCDAAGKGTGLDGGMGFAEACRHVCAHLSKKARGAHRWNADDFVPDRRAIGAISQVLELCGTKAEDADSLRIADSVGERIRCSACSLSMAVRSVAYHCKRHEEISFTLLPATEVSELSAIEHGLALRLLEKSNEAASERGRKMYGCRHCARRSMPATADAASDASSGQEGMDRAQLKPKWMSFDGLRSHLKEKHHVQHVADEDFYRQQEATVAEDSA